MIKRNKGTLILTSCVILLPLLVGLILWSKLPDQVPIHWNVAGEVDNYTGKPFAVIVLPLILLALHWFCSLLTSADPKYNDHHNKYIHIVLWIVPGISVLICAFMYTAALGIDMPIEAILPLLLGLLFVIIGNAMPKFPQSYTIGIKLPWTLNSEENWYKTHRLGGKLWVAGGFAVILLSLLGAALWMFAVLLVMVLVPTIYSYLLYRKSKTEE